MSRGAALRRSPRPALPWRDRLRAKSIRRCLCNVLHTVVHRLTTPPSAAGDGVADPPSPVRVTRSVAAALPPPINWSECIFCGAPCSSVDHLHPMRRGGRLTGYCNERWNAVPACATCNSSKCGRDWRAWMVDRTAKGSPAARGVSDLQRRVRALEAFDAAAHRHRTVLHATEQAQGLLDLIARKVDAFAAEVNVDMERLRAVVWRREAVD